MVCIPVAKFEQWLLRDAVLKRATGEWRGDSPAAAHVGLHSTKAAQRQRDSVVRKRPSTKQNSSYTEAPFTSEEDDRLVGL